MNFTFETPDSLDVALRDGPSLAFDLTRLSNDYAQKAFMLGIGQKARNFAASALMDCKVASAGNKTDGESDDAYKARLDKIIVDTETLQAKQIALITAGFEKAYFGEWGAERVASQGRTPVQEMMIKLYVAVKKPTLAKGLTPNARATAVTALIDAMPQDKRDLLATMAEKEIARMASLANAF